MTAPETPVRPLDIFVSAALLDAWPDRQVSEAAARIVRFCQKEQGNWPSFASKDFAEYSQRLWHEETSLDGLQQIGVIKIGRTRVDLTVRFVATCYGASPVY